MQFTKIPTVTLPPRPGKSRLGCASCKQRHIRCDQTSPACNACQKKGLQCPGYKSLPIRWVDGPKTLKKKRTAASRTEDNRIERCRGSLSNDADYASDLRGDNPSSSRLLINSVHNPQEVIKIPLTSEYGNQDLLRNEPDCSIEQGVSRDPYQTRHVELSESSTWLLVRQVDDQPAILDFLTAHYFGNVASIFTIFDGPTNPFGEEIRLFADLDETLRNSIGSIAAIHLADSNTDVRMRDYGLGFRGKAVSILRESVKMEQWDANAFVSSLLLCMTESYFLQNDCGKTYLETARQLIAFDETAYSTTSRSLRNAFCWLEMLVSLVSDYSSDTSPAVVYDPRVTEDDLDPLLGTWASIFPSIGRLARLIRRLRKNCERELLPSDVRAIEAYLLDWQSDFQLDAPNALRLNSYNEPTESFSRDCPTARMSCFDLEGNNSLVGESVPSNVHYAWMAHAYRLAALLELYQHFPLLLRRRKKVVDDGSSCAEFLNELASSIISLLRRIPIESRLFNVGSFPLMSAGQLCTSEAHRSWILSIFDYLKIHNGIAAVANLGDTLKEVWERRDNGDNVTWLDIFDERNCRMLIN